MLKKLLNKAKEGIATAAMGLAVAAGPWYGCGIESGTPPEEPVVYGVIPGTTIENLKVEECICSEDVPQGKDLFLYDLQPAKAIWFTIHGGACPFCRQQSAYMQNTDVYGRYKDKGLGILMLLCSDEAGNLDRENLLDYCCEHKKEYGFAFPVAIDSEAAITRKYTTGIPLNMLIDNEKVIQYKVAGFFPEGLEAFLNALLEGSQNKSY